MERASKSSDEDQNVDRLSALPDGVICHILSFLGTQRSVQTSVLAKRWRTLWAHVPVLDFNYLEHIGSRRKIFPGMVCAVMLRHKVQSLITFRLICPDDDDGPCNYEVETCIAVAVERNVQNLRLESPHRVEVPRCLLTCKTLIDLTLESEGISIPPIAPISLPNLKKLHLWNLDCEVDFTRLLSGCPVLEVLIIEETTCRDPRGCYISSPTLKRLTLMYLLDISMLDNPDYMVTIDTPALRYLKVIDNCSYKHFSISLCTSLVEANIRILCEPNDIDRRCVLKLLDSIRNVKCLKFRSFRGKICGGSMPSSIVKFDNITILELSAPWCLLPKFLQTPDHLEVLTIIEYEHSKLCMDPVEERCACRLHSLRTVRICDFKCTEQGFNMVRYILRNAQVLERIEINCSYPDLNERFDAIRRISTFPRESKKCELHFSSD